MTRLILILGLVTAAHAATVKGTVREIPGNAPIAGVKVTLGMQSEPRATTFTGSDGAYEFRSVPPGDYTVEVAKAGGYWWTDGGSYMLETGGLNVSVGSDDASVTRNLQMVRPAVLRGRVVDEDGNPVAGMSVGLSHASAVGYSPTSETTDAEGRFAFRKLIANSYVVRTGPRSVMTMPLRDFAEADIGKVDEDYPVSYWPGGSTDPAALLPVAVPPGGDIDLGNLRPRKVALYRTLVRLGDARLRDEACEGNVTLTLTQPIGYFAGGIAANFSMPCAPEYLLTGLTEGRWGLRVTKPSRWAMADIDAGPDARPVDVRMQDVVTITGRVVAGEGVKLPENLRGRISLAPVTAGPLSAFGEVIERRFAIERVFGVPYRVRASLLNPPYYAAEFRYAGHPVLDGVITPVAGAELEVVIDDQPGAINGMYSGEGSGRVTVLIFKVRNGGLEDTAPPLNATGGRYTATNLPPGDYQIIAVRDSSLQQALREGPIQKLVLSRGQTVTVRRGETTNINLRVQ